MAQFVYSENQQKQAHHYEPFVIGNFVQMIPEHHTNFRIFLSDQAKIQVTLLSGKSHRR